MLEKNPGPDVRLFPRCGYIPGMMTGDGKVAIIGLGLLGTSLALALKRAGGCRVSGWTRNASVRERLLNDGAIDATSEDVEDVIKSADITVLCMPVPQISEFCLAHAKNFKKGSIVTDVGSVKGVIMEKGAPAVRAAGCAFVGGHPMAGSEKSGPEAARANLFDGAAVFLTPVDGADAQAVAKLRSMWESVGGQVAETSPETHDELIAKSSHLPHAVAWTLALTALDVPQACKGLAHMSCANSFKDMTRVATSSPELWSGIFEANKECLLDAIDQFKARLDLMRELVESNGQGALRKMMEQGKTLREEWASARNRSNHSSK